MKDDITASLNHPPSTVRARYPDEITLGIFGITEKTARFSAGMKLAERVRNNAGSTGCAKWPKIR